MNLSILKSGKAASKSGVEVSETTFAREFNEALVHQVVVAFMAGARQGTRAQKTRSEAHGGGRKPFRQKGTGRARAGTIRSPIWRGGGKALAAKPQDFSQKVNKKMYRGAMQSILSELVRQERLMVVEEFSVTAPKTKEFVAKLEQFQLNPAAKKDDSKKNGSKESRHSVLVVVEEVEEVLYLSARNLRNVDVVDVQGANPVALIGVEKVLITLGALKKLEETLS